MVRLRLSCLVSPLLFVVVVVLWRCVRVLGCLYYYYYYYRNLAFDAEASAATPAT